MLNRWPKGLHDLLADLGFSYTTRRGHSVKTGRERFSDALMVRLWQGESQFVDDAIEEFFQQRVRRRELSSDRRERWCESRYTQLRDLELSDVFEDVESSRLASRRLFDGSC